MNIPLITIGITSFNASNTIGRAVRSALAQDWKNIEIIIVDDCSIDNSFEIIESLKEKYEGLTIIQNIHNSGVAFSRNTIVNNATGEFIVFFDDDDKSRADRLTKQYNRITEYEGKHANGAPVICHCARSQIYPDGTVHYELTMGMREGCISPHGLAVAQRILTGKPFEDAYGSTATCSQMARVDVYRNLGGFDNEFRRSEDTDFNIRLALAGGHFVGIADELVVQSMTLTSDKKISDELDCTLQLLEKYKNFINEVDSYIFCREWIITKYILLSGNKVQFIAKLLRLFLLYPVKTLKRLYWALPNISFNVKFSKFYNEKR